MDPGELRRIAILADLPDERLAELARHGTELTLESGEYLFREGEEATFLSLLLDGELETTRSVGGDELPLLHHEPGGFLGAISLVTGGVYGGSTRSVGVSRLFLLEPEAFRGLLVSEPAIFTAVMGVFVPVITNFTAMERDRDRLLSLRHARGWARTRAQQPRGSRTAWCIGAAVRRARRPVRPVTTRHQRA